MEQDSGVFSGVKNVEQDSGVFSGVKNLEQDSALSSGVKTRASMHWNRGAKRPEIFAILVAGARIFGARFLTP